MTQQTINIGNQPGDGTGDPARTAFTKVNQNFTEVYANATPGGSVGQIQYKLAGTSFGGFTASGDATINTTTGAISVTKTGGVSFAASATTDTTVAANVVNVPSGTIAATNVQSAINEIVTDLSASSGSSLVGFLQSGTGAFARTVQAKERDFVSVKDFGATGDGTTDDTAAFNAALTAATGGTVFLPPPSVAYLLSSATITVPNNTKIVGATKQTTKILHGFNGDMFILTQGAGIENVYLEGQGATYSGRAMVCQGTDGAQTIVGVKAINFNGNVLYFAYQAGSQSFVENCIFYQYSATTGSGKYAIAIDTTANLSAVPKTFIGLQTGGSPSISFGGCNDVFVSGSFLADLAYTADTRSAQIVNSRLANQAALTINGHNNTIVGCDINPALTIAASADNIALQGNSYNNPPITDNSANARNLLDMWMQSYTPALTSGGTAPSLGNGTITGTYARTGATTTITGELTLGTTTSLGTGGLSISLPMTKQTADVFVGGTVYMNRGGTIYMGFLQIAGSASAASLLRDTTGSVTFNSPATFASGDIIRWSATFRN
jgi:hypothetical protein